MPSKLPCYYRAGKNKRGKKESCIDVVNSDKNREKFLDRLKNDENFRTRELRWTEKPVEDYVNKYKERAKCPGENIHSADILMCTSLYLRGIQIEKTEKHVKIETKPGKVEEFDIEHWCPYDESHDLPADEMPDDVCKIKAFGEAALLRCMRKRHCDALNIYTYVADIVLCMNPYMKLPKMEDIKEYPEQIIYRPGSNPSSYASAHFAYYGTLDATAEKRNNSCIVSGESGAGKTVACGFIMKYLAKLSDWRKMKLNEYDPEDKSDITKLVAGVSPFLEMFGNAKTRMNDNSSGFGKFTKIWFQDGKIIGAELVHYLLEKARLADQGAGERNYHIFYGLIRGATAEEKSRLKLKDPDEYEMLMGGGSSIVGHGNGPEYDVARFNNPLHDDPDHTGIRAALKSANVDMEQQAVLWNTCAGILKLLDVKFEKGEEENSSKVKDLDALSEVEKLLGLGGDFSESLSKILVINRIKPKGEKPIDSPTNVMGAQDNRNALGKETYGRIFAWLIDDVCNNALEPKGTKDAFVGLLDIFGFEVMAKNSIEQLCINFANEKLQQLFNKHVFDEEEKIYTAEGLSTEALPDHPDNTPCCNLVAMSSKKFMGIFASLDEATKVRGKMTDRKFLQKLVTRFGRKKKKPGEVFKKAKGLVAKQASMFFFAHKKKDYLFDVVHYAKDVEYDVRCFLEKNKDKLPVQLEDNMKLSGVDFVKSLFDPKTKKKKKKSHDNTLGSKYLTSLKALAKTLTATSPNYVRCVKPNGIHYRPVDGNAAFDEEKTYRQLLYAGVMQVVKIKNDGYPYRLEFQKFWDLCCSKEYHNFLNMSRNTDAMEGTKAIATAALKPPETKKIPGTEKTRIVHSWTCGKSLFFSKADTLDRLLMWHQNKVAGSLQMWWRYTLLRLRCTNFDHAATFIGLTYRAVMNKRKYAKIEGCVIQLMNMIRGVRGYKLYRKLQNQRIAGTQCVKAYKNYLACVRYDQCWKKIVHLRASSYLDKICISVVDAAKVRLARSSMLMKIKLKLMGRRRLVCAQKLLRLSCGIADLRRGQRWLEIMKSAAGTCAGLYQMSSSRTFFGLRCNLATALQPHLRMLQSRNRFLETKNAALRIQAYSRMWAFKRVMKMKIESIEKIQQFGRWNSVRRWYSRFSSAGKIIERFFYEVLLQKRFKNWIGGMQTACLESDDKQVNSLITLKKPFACLSHIPIFMLVNMKDKVYYTSFMHRCAESGSLTCAQLLVAHGCRVDVHDSTGNSPLHVACQRGDAAVKVSKYILEHSLNPAKLLSTPNHEGMYPCDLVLECEGERHEMIMMLLEMGADASEDTLLCLEREIEVQEASKRVRSRQKELLNKQKIYEEKKDAHWFHTMLVMPDSSFLKKELMSSNNLEREVESKRSSSSSSSNGKKNVVNILSTKCEDRAVIMIQKARDLKYVLKLQAHVRRFLIYRKLTKTKRPIMLSHVDPKEWVSRYTAAGRKYYFNKSTGHRTWDKVGRRRASDVTMLMAKKQRNDQVRAIEEEAYRVAQKNKSIENEIDKLKQKLRHLTSATSKVDSDGRDIKKRKSSTILNLKQSLLRAMIFCQNPTQPHWYFIDGSQKRHGPYSESQMFQWRKHFHPRQHISRSGIGPYARIQDVFSSSSSSSDEPDFRIDIHDLRDARSVLLGFLRDRYNCVYE